MGEEILIPVTFFAAVVLSIYFFLKARSSERLALIEKGMDMSKLRKKRVNGNVLVKTGLLFVGVSIGLILGYLLEDHSNIPETVAYFSMILLFGGISLVIGNYIGKKKEVAEEE